MIQRWTSGDDITKRVVVNFTEIETQIKDFPSLYDCYQLIFVLCKSSFYPIITSDLFSGRALFNGDNNFITVSV